MESKSLKRWISKAMRLLPLLIIASMLLSACGAEATPTAIVPTDTPVPAATDTPVAAPATDTPAAAAATDTPAAAAPEASPTKPKPAGSKEGTLTIWADSNRIKALTPLTTDFTAKYNIQVSLQELAFGDVRDQLKTAGPAGEGPDIIVGAHDWLGELVTNGLLEPMDLADKASSFDPVSIKAFTYEGKLYGVPYATEAIALMYNKDFVPTPPATWEELKTMAKKLQDDKKVEQGYVLQQADPYHSYPIFTGFGSYVFKQNPDGTYDPKDVGLDNAGGQAAMKEIDQMIKDGLLRKDVNGDLMQSLFKEKKSAMMFTGPWALPDVKKAGINYGIAKIPKMTQAARPFVGSQGFMVSAFGKNKLLAQTFLTEFVATDAAMKAIYDNDPRIPAWLPVKNAIDDADIKAFGESAADGEPLPAIPQMSAVWDAWSKAITLVFQQQEDPVKAITDAATAIRAKISQP